MDPKDYRVDAAIETVRQIYRCWQCRELILSDYVVVDKRSFHVQCFKCKMCSASLISGYFPLYPDVLCQECYSKFSKSDCRSCKKPLTDENDHVVTAENARWHAACFVCQECKKPLSKDGLYYSMDSSHYCLAHYCAKKYAAAGKKWPPVTATESAEKSSSSSSSSAGSPPKTKS
uniref:LIM zinc-binding domain-containing protein n=1 Tax=Romanomermis culicivorax TaxID=13658 RepID=A0A915HUD7_ROMCU